MRLLWALGKVLLVTIKHSYKSIFLWLFAFYMLAGFVAFSYKLFIVKGAPLTIITDHLDVWIPLAKKPILVGIVLSVLGAFGIQWSYKCDICSNTIFCRDTWGRYKKYQLEDISSINMYKIPFFKILRLRFKGKKTSCWVAGSALCHINQESLTRVST